MKSELKSQKKIRIGVDARPLSTPLSGVGRVIAMVLQRFPDRENFEFVLYSHRPWHEDFDSVIELPNVIWIQGRGILAKKGGLWFNLALPGILAKARLDLFWGSQQVIPPFLPSRIPVVLTYYDLVLYLFPGAMRKLARIQQRMFQRYSVNRASRILCISSQTRTDLISRFKIPPEKARVSLLGYEKPSKRGKETSPRNDGEDRKLPEGPYILAVSTIEPRKNYSTLLEAYFSYYQSEGEEKAPYPLVIAGRRGWESEEFYRRLAEIQSETGRVWIYEGLSDLELLRLYENCAFFTLPSLYEGFGLPLLEAMASGKFAIVSDTGSFREIGKKEVIYLPAKDVGLWSLTLKETVDRHRAGKLPAVKFSKEEWSWENTSQTHYEAFVDALSP